jgi:hypothetical protein
MIAPIDTTRKYVEFGLEDSFANKTWQVRMPKQDFSDHMNQRTVSRFGAATIMLIIVVTVGLFRGEYYSVVAAISTILGMLYGVGASKYALQAIASESYEVAEDARRHDQLHEH